MNLRHFPRYTHLLLLWSLAGCASQESPGISVLRAAARGELSGAAREPVFAPQYRYLRARLNDLPPTYLVLGFVDTDGGTPVYTWVSATNEVLKIKSGRIIGTTGLPQDWTRVSTPALPTWRELQAGPVQYTRTRDEAREYAYGQIETVMAERLHHAIPSKPDASLVTPAAWWISESTQSEPTAWYAFTTAAHGEQWVYTHQCLRPDFCLSLQPWPAPTP